MTGAMYAAIGGLKTHMSNLNVIGNNIANVNTVGYKAQRMTFQESIYTMSKSGSNGTLTVGGNNPSQVGYGASIGSIDLNMSPGTYSPTGYDLDCMLMGEGFFLVGDKDITIGGASDLNKFDLTRVGDFWKDANGFIADRGGAVAYGFRMVQNPFKGAEVKWAKMLGYTGAAANNVISEGDDGSDTIISATLGPMKVPVGAAAPSEYNGGIDADGNHVWEEGDPVYDLLGAVSRDLSSGVLTRGTVSLEDIVTEAVAATSGREVPADATDGEVHFAADEDFGALDHFDIPIGTGDTATTMGVWAYTDKNGAYRVLLDDNQNVLKIEFIDGTGTASGGMIEDATNPGQYTLAMSAGPAFNDFSPDNYTYDPTSGKLINTQWVDPATGELTADGQGAAPAYFDYNGPLPNKNCTPIEAESMSVSAQGGIYGITDTGLTFFAGYLGIGSCASNDGVTNIGGPYYKCQEGAGEMRVAALGALLQGRYIGNTLNILLDGTTYQPPAVNRVLSGGTNEIKNGGLEASGTDVATEFSNMIITQRGYQANTRIVSVTDSMLEELVNMKR